MMSVRQGKSLAKGIVRTDKKLDLRIPLTEEMPWLAQREGDILFGSAVLRACWREEFGSSGRTRTYNPSVNSRMLYH